ncbi:hypothetical protein D3C71_2048590 [compost metagenome]
MNDSFGMKISRLIRLSSGSTNPYVSRLWNTPTVCSTPLRTIRTTSPSILPPEWLLEVTRTSTISPFMALLISFAWIYTSG